MSKFITSVTAAGAIAALTLSVFSVLREYSPEATVRRWHQAAATNDIAALKRLSAQPDDMSSISYLAQRVSSYVNRGAQIRIPSVDRSQPDRVIATFVYILPGRTDVLYWVVRKGPSGWLVSNQEMVNTRMYPSVGFNSRS